MIGPVLRTLLVFPLLSCHAEKTALPPGIKAGLYGDIVGHSDFQLNLRPPEENKHDTEKALDAIMKLEEDELRAMEDEFVLAKQRMLNTEKMKISDIISVGFAPLMKKLQKI